MLITGPSGAGKSDLALRLIDRGAVLVADDQVLASASPDGVTLDAPPAIAGKLEVRGLGILDLPHAPAPLALCVALGGPVERLPRPAVREVAGVAAPELALDSRPASAPLKVELALRHPHAAVP